MPIQVMFLGHIKRFWFRRVVRSIEVARPILTSGSGLQNVSCQMVGMQVHVKILLVQKGKVDQYIPYENECDGYDHLPLGLRSIYKESIAISLKCSRYGMNFWQKKIGLLGCFCQNIEDCARFTIDDTLVTQPLAEATL